MDYVGIQHGHLLGQNQEFVTELMVRQTNLPSVCALSESTTKQLLRTSLLNCQDNNAAPLHKNCGNDTNRQMLCNSNTIYTQRLLFPPSSPLSFSLQPPPIYFKPADRLLRSVGIEILLEADAELLPQRLQLLEVLLVLALVLDLGLDTCVSKC